MKSKTTDSAETCKEAYVATVLEWGDRRAAEMAAARERDEAAANLDAKIKEMNDEV